MEGAHIERGAPIRIPPYVELSYRVTQKPTHLDLGPKHTHVRFNPKTAYGSFFMGNLSERYRECVASSGTHC